MESRLHSKTSLLLMELMINLLIFLMLVSICVQFFVKSYNLKTKAKELTFGVEEVCNLAELYQNKGGNFNEMTDTYPDLNITSGDSSCLFFDENNATCSESEAFYKLSLDRSVYSNDSICKISFVRISDSEEIYSVECDLHSPIVVGGGS